MLSLTKKIAVLFVLLSFITIALFSFAVMVKEPDGRMSGNCPFSAMGVSLCPQDVITMVFHHASAYQSFINIPVSFGAAALISLFLIAGAFLMASLRPSLLRLPVHFGTLYNPPPNASQKRKATHWLALHENSPAVL